MTLQIDDLMKITYSLFFVWPSFNKCFWLTMFKVSITYICINGYKSTLNLSSIGSRNFLAETKQWKIKISWLVYQNSFHHHSMIRYIWFKENRIPTPRGKKTKTKTPNTAFLHLVFLMAFPDEILMPQIFYMCVCICTVYIKRVKNFFTPKERNSTHFILNKYLRKHSPMWTDGLQVVRLDWLNQKFLTNLLGLLFSYLDPALLLRAQFINVALMEDSK